MHMVYNTYLLIYLFIALVFYVTLTDFSLIPLQYNSIGVGGNQAVP